MRTIALTTVTLILLASLVGRARAASDPAAEEGQRLARFIRLIEAESDPTVATVVYARAVELFPRQPRPHVVYIRRVLELGLPELAYQPAGALLKLDSENALAWAVVAHMQARRNEFAEALSTALKAVDSLRDDPFVLDVAGQLVAWYDHAAGKSQVPQAVKRKLEDVRPNIERKEAFSKAYEAAKALFEAHAIQTDAAEEIAGECDDGRIPCRSVTEDRDHVTLIFRCTSSYFPLCCPSYCCRRGLIAYGCPYGLIIIGHFGGRYCQHPRHRHDSRWLFRRRRCEHPRRNDMSEHRPCRRDGLIIRGGHSRLFGGSRILQAGGADRPSRHLLDCSGLDAARKPARRVGTAAAPTPRLRRIPAPWTRAGGADVLGRTIGSGSRAVDHGRPRTSLPSRPPRTTQSRAGVIRPGTMGPTLPGSARGGRMAQPTRVIRR